MTRYWQADPNHQNEWGEKGGLPIDPRTIHTDVENGKFVSTDAHTVAFGGHSGAIPKNATEMQKWRETHQVPAKTIGMGLSQILPYVYFDGSGNVFVTADASEVFGVADFIGVIAENYFVDTVSVGTPVVVSTSNDKIYVE